MVAKGIALRYFIFGQIAAGPEGPTVTEGMLVREVKRNILGISVYCVADRDFLFAPDR